MRTNPLHSVSASIQNQGRQGKEDKIKDLTVCERAVNKSQVLAQAHLYTSYSDRADRSSLKEYADTIPNYYQTTSQAVYAAYDYSESDKGSQPILADQPHMVLTASQVKHVLKKEKNISSPLKKHKNLSSELKKELGEATYKQVMAYMKDKGESWVKKAAEAERTLVVEVDAHHHLIFKPSGKVYISAKKIGEGKFKVTSKVALIMATEIKTLQKMLHIRAFSLTKEISNAKQQELSKEEKEVNLYLKQQAKTHDLSHVNVAKSVSTVNLDQVGVMSELCDTDVDNLLVEGNLTDEEKLNIAAQMSRGVAQLHKIGVVHRDIKPDNFLVRIGEQGEKLIKITDFGLSSQVEPSKRTTNTSVSIRYSDPAWRGTDSGADIRFSTPSDVYQLGVSICQVYAGCTVRQWVALQAQEMNQFQEPGVVKDQSQLLREWKTHPDQWRALQTIQDPSVRAMVRRMVDSDPANRPSAKEVVVFLEKRQQSAI